jgi:hypothetical protein
MDEGTFKFVGRKIIIRLRDRTCETPEELLSSRLFRKVLDQFVAQLRRDEAPLLKIFDKRTEDITEADVQGLVEIFQFLAKMEIELLPRLVEGSERYVKDPSLLNDFVEGLYNYWREFERFMVCDSEGESLDRRPYRTFHATSESLMHLLRRVYRDVQENITGKHPNIYRQVRSGAEIAAIALPRDTMLPEGVYQKLKGIPVIRQVLLYPPLLLNPPMNKRTGRFERVEQNPLELLALNKDEWLCYPAKVGPLLVLIYFHEKFFELGFSLCNLFELAEDEFLSQQVDAIYVFGVPGTDLDPMATIPTVFHEDTTNEIVTAAVPDRDEFGYFGYLKKMVLTLHNVKMMRRGRMPFHGALVRFILKGDKPVTILLIGDTGAGKSETIEAFRTIGGDDIEEMVIIADDMGSLDLDSNGNIVGYGSEIGAFVRLDDLQPGYAFGQLDRTIIMNPSQVNARVVLPVTNYEHVIEGYSIDMVLYANNYEEIDEDHPIIERAMTLETALNVFREGTSMSKGTTTSTGLMHTYYVNIFGAVQYKALHEEIARRYFEAFFRRGTFVGQLRTRLGIVGWERSGPEEAARELLRRVREGDQDDTQHKGAPHM